MQGPKWPLLINKVLGCKAKVLIVWRTVKTEVPSTPTPLTLLGQIIFIVYVKVLCLTRLCNRQCPPLSNRPELPSTLPWQLCGRTIVVVQIVLVR